MLELCRKRLVMKLWCHHIVHVHSFSTATTDKPAFPPKTPEMAKEANALSSSSGVEALRRDVKELQSKREETMAYHERLMAYLMYKKEQQQYYTRLAQFVQHHFDEMDRKAIIDFAEGPDSLHTDCEDWPQMVSADRAKEEYTEVLTLKEEVGFYKNAIRSESTSPVEAEKLNKELKDLDNKIHDRLTKMATEYNFDGNAELFDQAMSVAVRYEVDGAVNPAGALNAFFNTCCTGYNPEETRELLSFLQNKYPRA